MQIRSNVGLLAAAVFVTSLSLPGTACEFGEGSERGESSKVAAENPKITEEQAKAAAIKALPGNVQSVRLETEDGRSVYEVTIQPEPSGNPTQAPAAATNVLVDANTGKVVKTEASAADKDKDKDDDD